MKYMILAMILELTGIPGARAADIPLGVFGDDLREVTCMTGSAGDTFRLTAWVHVPDQLGLAYVTYRFDFPSNIDFNRRPVFHDQVSGVVFTEFVDGTSEWNMTFAGCPVGWIMVFSQECVLLDDQPSRIGILGTHSMVRDCTFVLNDVNVLNELDLNDPQCQTVFAGERSWGGVKSLFR